MLPLGRIPSIGIRELELPRILPHTRLQFVLLEAALDDTDEFIPANDGRERVVLRVAVFGGAMPVAGEGDCGVFVAGFLEVAEDEIVDVVGAERPAGGHGGGVRRGLESGIRWGFVVSQQPALNRSVRSYINIKLLDGFSQESRYTTKIEEETRHRGGGCSQDISDGRETLRHFGGPLRAQSIEMLPPVSHARQNSTSVPPHHHLPHQR